MSDEVPTIRIGPDGRRYNDYPFESVVAKAQELAAQGHRCYQKFSCEKCGQRLGIDKPNAFYEYGACDRCGHTTNIKRRGCNYLLVSRIGSGRSGQ